MKKMVIVFTMFLLTVGLFALDIQRNSIVLLKNPENYSLIVGVSQPNGNNLCVSTDFLEIKVIYKEKGTDSDKEKYYNENTLFYKECATEEEYVVTVYRFLSTLDLYWHFYYMTEKQVANECGKKGGNKNGTYGKEWQVEYKDFVVVGIGDGHYFIILK